MSYSKEHEAYIKEHGDIQPDEDYEMNLGVHERRKLYLLAKGKCSLCETDLFLREHNTDIAAECHISSHKKNHPSKTISRYDPNLTPKERDKSYNNAILMCRLCHEIIDNPENTQYTIEELHRIKEKHEMKVIEGDKSKECSERHKQLHDWIHDHNQGLIDSFIKPWSKSEFVDMPNLFAIQHLQSGYLDVWKLRPDKARLTRIVEDRKGMEGSLVKEFGGLPDGFEYKYFSDIEKTRVYKLLEDFFQNDEMPEDSTIKDSNEFVEAILNHMVLNDKIKSLNKNEDIRDEKSLEFELGLDKIIFGIEEQHKELRGTCKICKDWHDELKSPYNQGA